MQKAAALSALLRAKNTNKEKADRAHDGEVWNYKPTRWQKA